MSTEHVMDFALSDEQTAIVELARRILVDRCTLEHLKEVEGGAEWFDRDTWAELAKAGLLGIALPESVGGGGFGYLEAALLLEEQGRAVAPIPLWATLTAALTIAEFGSDAQQQQWLPGVVDGSTVLAVAVTELDADTRTPQTRASAPTATPSSTTWNWGSWLNVSCRSIDSPAASVGTTKRRTPSSVRAGTTMADATCAALTVVLTPVRVQPSPSAVARV